MKFFTCIYSAQSVRRIFTQYSFILLIKCTKHLFANSRLEIRGTLLTRTRACGVDGAQELGAQLLVGALVRVVQELDALRVSCRAAANLLYVYIYMCVCKCMYACVCMYMYYK